MNFRRVRQLRRGYSFVEIAVALPTIGILTVGMCSAVLLSVRAIPQDGSIITASVETARAMEQFERDLRCALSVSKRDSQEIQFTVPDRTGDDQPESIRYWWTGVVGSPFYRSVNGGPEEVVVGQTEKLLLSYDIQPRVSNRVVEKTTTSDELLLASFESWPGVTPTVNEFNITSSDWITTSFQLPNSVPKHYSQLRFSKAEVYARRGLPIGSTKIGIYRINSSLEPRTSYRLGSETSVSASSIPSSWGWFQTTLANDVISSDASRTFSMIYSGSSIISPMRLRYLTSASAPKDIHPTGRSTDDGGDEWEPDSNLHENDLMFRIYGIYETVTVESIPETKQHFRTVGIELRSASNKSINIDSIVRLLNEPEAVPTNAPSQN